jgi:hypothetical protein
MSIYNPLDESMDIDEVQQHQSYQAPQQSMNDNGKVLYIEWYNLYNNNNNMSEQYQSWLQSHNPNWVSTLDNEALYNYWLLSRFVEQLSTQTSEWLQEHGVNDEWRQHQIYLQQEQTKLLSELWQSYLQQPQPQPQPQLQPQLQAVDDTSDMVEKYFGHEARESELAMMSPEKREETIKLRSEIDVRHEGDELRRQKKAVENRNRREIINAKAEEENTREAVYFQIKTIEREEQKQMDKEAAEIAAQNHRQSAWNIYKPNRTNDMNYNLGIERDFNNDYNDYLMGKITLGNRRIFRHDEDIQKEKERKYQHEIYTRPIEQRSRSRRGGKKSKKAKKSKKSKKVKKAKKTHKKATR